MTIRGLHMPLPLRTLLPFGLLLALGCGLGTPPWRRVASKPPPTGFAAWPLEARLSTHGPEVGLRLKWCIDRSVDGRRREYCELETATHFAVVEVAEDVDEMGADIDARGAREDGGVGEQTGTYSLGIHAWSLVPAVALRDEILPPGDRVRDLTQAELERRFGRLGWETNRCSRDLLDDNALIICTFTRLGEVAEVQAHVYFAAAAEPFDARENNQMYARVRQGDGALFVAVRDPATAAALWAALDQPPG